MEIGSPKPPRYGVAKKYSDERRPTASSGNPRRNSLRISERAMLASHARARLKLAHRVHTHTPSLSHAHPRPLHNHGVHGIHNCRGGGRSEGKASMGGAPALAGHDTACGCRVSSVVSKIFAVKKKKKSVAWLGAPHALRLRRLAATLCTSVESPGSDHCSAGRRPYVA